MKSAAILATVSAIASTASAQYFGIMVSRSASPIHFGQVNANDREFWIGKDTASYCPLDSGCPAGNQTLFAASGGSLSLATVVPGGQQVYIDPTTGAVGFTQAHSGSMPDKAILKGWTYTPPAKDASFGYLTRPRGFLACSEKGDANEGPWQVFVDLKTVKHPAGECLGFSALAVTGPEDGEQAGAWQYT